MPVLIRVSGGGVTSSSSSGTTSSGNTSSGTSSGTTSSGSSSKGLTTSFGFQTSFAFQTSLVQFDPDDLIGSSSSSTSSSSTSSSSTSSSSSSGGLLSSMAIAPDKELEYDYAEENADCANRFPNQNATYNPATEGCTCMCSLGGGALVSSNGATTPCACTVGL